jgi:CheY-like chemotaxis protein
VPTSRVILIAEDDPDDLFLLKRSFSKSGIINPIREVRSGHGVIAYLNGDGAYADRDQYPYPSILLLDINMPNGDGFEVLSWIRNKCPVKGMLVIVLSRLEDISGINRSYALGANSFLTKPGNAEDLQGLIRVFKDYWILRNAAPSIERDDRMG